MKQTAVEWLETQIVKFHNWKLNPIYDENCFDEIELDKSIKQAKEMEKEQQGYNDEEVKHIVSEALQSALATVDLDQFLQQFKKKIRWKLNS